MQHLLILSLLPQMLRIGKIVATHGLTGSVIMTHIIGHSNWLKKEDTLFIELKKDSFIPYFPAQVKANNNEEYVVNLEDVNTIEAARRLVGKHVYVNEEVLGKHADDSPLLWIGFTVQDKGYGNLGEIEDIMQTASQWLAKLTYKDKEVILPLIEQTIKGIDLKKKVLHMELPEGLLEVYL